jgi:nitroreductase
VSAPGQPAADPPEPAEGAARPSDTEPDGQRPDGAVDGLVEALTSTGAVRRFLDRPVPRDVLARVLDRARFAPSGGNQQAWRVVVVDDPERRRAIRDLYLAGWDEYVAQRRAAIQPWSPVGDREAEAAAIAEGGTTGIPADERPPGDFAAELDRVPVLAVVLADLRLLAATDRDLGRYTLVGGASIYPFVWSILLAGRAEGLGGVLTTVNVRREPELMELIGAPEGLAVAAVLALGYPVHQPTRLRRAEVASFATVDHVDGEPLRATPGPSDEAPSAEQGADRRRL